MLLALLQLQLTFVRLPRDKIHIGTHQLHLSLEIYTHPEMFSQNATERRAMMATARAVLAHPGTESERKREFSGFQASHPKLFGIICSGRCELTYLESMLRRMDEIEAGISTVEEASLEVAGELNRNFVDSVVPPPTPEQAASPGEGPVVQVVEALPMPTGVTERTRKGVKRTHGST